MILHPRCPLCHSNSLSAYAMDLTRVGPHISRVKCQDCKVVFANPMADHLELERYYQNYYEKDHYQATDYKKIILSHFERISTLNLSQIKNEARYLSKLVKGGVNF